MTWQIPAKTFLVGEYVALTQGPAIIITTTPYFELSVTDKPGLGQINAQSPAGLFWQKQSQQHGLEWIDPYQGIGGLGASSAQFIGCYLAACQMQKIKPSLSRLLEEYYRHSWSGTGLKPSGYDVIAQTKSGCVYVHKAKEKIETCAWPFANLSFILAHTGNKLATHQHLQTTLLPKNLAQMTEIAEQTYKAMLEQNPEAFIDSINNYNQALIQDNCVAEHSLNLIKKFKNYPEILAIKGCGAMGADVLLLITAQADKEKILQIIKQNNCLVLATDKTSATNPNLLD